MAVSLEEFLACQEAIYSNENADFILQTTGESDVIKQLYNYICIQRVSYNYQVMVIKRRDDLLSNFEFLGYRSFPKVYGLMDQDTMEAIGVNQIRRSPFLDLFGRDILIGFVDTGIDYQNDLFKNADNTSRITSIWDQTIKATQVSDEVEYGTIYKKEDIDRALQSEDPLSIVPSIDEIGHGTYMAGLAAGNIDPKNNFSGVAPQAKIAVVKLKPAKEYIKEFYTVPDEVVAYQENDIMLGISYLLKVAQEEYRPIVLCIGVGTNSGNHNGDSFLEDFISGFAASFGIGVAIAAGNEGARGIHYEGVIGNEEFKDVDVNIGEGENGITIELWAEALNTFSIGILSPSGEFSGKIPARLDQRQRINFLLEPSKAYVYYEISEKQSGNELIFIRITDPIPGVWKIRVYKESDFDQQFNMWLPIHEFIQSTTKFLESNPNVTVTSPGYVREAVTVGGYNSRTGSIYINSSRGFSIEGAIKPDIVAPAVDILAPIGLNQFGQRTGTSISAALTAGSIALIFEWGIVQRNDLTISGFKVNRFLIRGAERDERIYPNEEWGYGKLNVYNSFESIRNTE